MRSASVCAISSSWTAAFANRFHSSISRSSWSFGASAASAAFSRSTRYSRSCVRQRQRRLDRGAQIARRLVGFLEREVFGVGALVRALDELVDALHLLAERLLGRGRLGLGALAHGRLGGGEALADRLVEPFGLLLAASLHSRETASHA